MVSVYLVNTPPDRGRLFPYSAAFARLTSLAVAVTGTVTVSRRKLVLVNASWVTF